MDFKLHAPYTPTGDQPQAIEKLANGGASSILLVIGASDGIPEQLKAVCQYRLSFSRMTFPHQLMRVILLEQIYRAMNINGGGKYHK